MQPLQGNIANAEAVSYYTEVLSKENLWDVANLHARIYSVPVDEDYFTRKYDTAYTGIQPLGFLAYTHDRIPIAFYGVIPCFLKFGDQTILSAQSADTMTDPKYRYKGMFVQLSNLTFDLCKQFSIPIIFGFPNQNSYHGAVNKLGWQLTTWMNYFQVPVAAFSAGAILKKLAPRLHIRYTRSKMKKYLVAVPGLPNSCLADGFGGVLRSKEYLDYKQYAKTYVLQVNNARVWISTKHGWTIGDMEGVDDSNFVTVMKNLRRIAGKAGVRRIAFHSSPGTKLHRLFSDHYAPADSFATLFQDFGSGIPLQTIKFTFADIDIF